MHWKAILFAAALLAGCDNAGTAQRITGAYGSLDFDGLVDRRSEGDNYIYTVRHLDLTFDPDADTNRVERITDASLRFATTVKAADGAPYRSTHEALVPVDVTLDASQRNASVRDVQFVVPRSLVEAADHAGLALVGSGLMWPIPGEFKD